MKLIPTKPGSKKRNVSDLAAISSAIREASETHTPRDRAVTNVQTELYRLTIAVDELKVKGTVEELDAAQRVLWGALLVVDGLIGRK